MTRIAPLRIYQICYSPQTLESLAPSFLVLDNLRNERPDWREYWPIRTFLMQQASDVDTQALYGFFSPRFTYKTSLSFADIRAFVDRRYQGEDVVNISPFWDLSSLFLNPFEQGDCFHPGLRETTRDFVRAIGWDPSVVDTVMHGGNTVFCNYFLARMPFWHEWLALGERLFDIAENDPGDLGQRLRANTSYGDEPVPMKVFVMERLASLLMAAQPQWTSIAWDAFSLAPSTTPLNQYFEQALCADALKRQWAATGSSSALGAFARIRGSIFGISEPHPTEVNA